MKESNSENDSRTVPEASNVDESTIELVFSRDCLIIRSPVVVPLKGKLVHEERVGYAEIPPDGFNMRVVSVSKQEEGGHLIALVFKVSGLDLLSSDRQADQTRTSAIVTVRSRSWIEYSYMTIKNEFRSMFPGYKVPFVIETDQGDIITHVGSAPKHTAYGAPLEGYMISGLRKWYSAHPEIRTGSQLSIETLEPGKRYRLSSLGTVDHLVTEEKEKRLDDFLSHLTSNEQLEELTKELMDWAQGQNIRAISHADVKLFLVHKGMRQNTRLEQMLYREAKLKYRYLPPWMREEQQS